MPTATIDCYARTRRRRVAIGAMRTARHLPLPRRARERVAISLVTRLLVFEYRVGSGPWKRVHLRPAR